MAAPSDNLTERNSWSLSPPTDGGIVIDIGTGDGHFVYQCARQNPGKFYIGIDANPRPLEKISEKIHRRAAKGGLANVLFLHAAVEDLLDELSGVADEIHVHFPWGSLLRAVATGEQLVLGNLRRICAEGAWLEVIIGLDPHRDHSEVARLELPVLSMDYLAKELVHKYLASGFEVVEKGILSATTWPDIKSAWAKRLRRSSERILIYLIARATVVPAS